MSEDRHIRSGQRYRAREDIAVLFLTHWTAPFTGGGKAIIPSGTIFTVTLDPPAAATGVHCDPEDYAALERRLVSERDRSASNYSGFSLVIGLESIRSRCDRLSG